MSDDIFDEKNKVKDNAHWIKWGKVGDKLSGTYIDRHDYERDGEARTDYVILVKEGFYHDGEEKVTLEEGEEVRVNHKKGFEKFYKGQVKPGQLCGFVYEEDIKLKDKKLSAFKKIGVYLPKEQVEEVDPETNEKKLVWRPKYNHDWLTANELTVEDVQAAK